MPTEETFPTPLEYIDVVRRTNAAFDVLLGDRIDNCWNVDCGKELSEPWNGFTQFTILNEKPTDGLRVVLEGLTKIQATSRPDFFMARNMVRNVESCSA